MKAKMICQITIDLIMSVLLLLLMAFQIIGQEVHEWIGAGMLILFLMHNLLNIKWYQNLAKGSYTAFRVSQTVVNLLVLVSMLSLMISGIIMSRHVFDFLSISGSMSFARTLHLAASYWSFVLIAIHLGLHWAMVLGFVRKLSKWTNGMKAYDHALRVIAVLLAAFGLYAFHKNGILSYMLLKNRFVFFDFEQSAVSVLGEYLAMMGLWVLIAHYAATLLRKLPSAKKDERRKKHEATKKNTDHLGLRDKEVVDESKPPC